MPALLPLIGLVKWPLTLGAAVVVFGVSSEGTLGLISEHTHPSVMKRASMSATVIKVPTALTITAPKMQKSLSLLATARPIAAGAATLADATVASLPTMQVTTSGLVVRSHPLKASPQVGVLMRGDTVEVRGKQSGWLLIASPSGTVGWVFGKYLAPKRPVVADGASSPSNTGTPS